MMRRSLAFEGFLPYLEVIADSEGGIAGRAVVEELVIAAAVLDPGRVVVAALFHVGSANKCNRHANR
jgi:hypothetical protein